MVGEVVEKDARGWAGVAGWELGVAGKWELFCEDTGCRDEAVVYES
jgi:hypothetical protein